MTAQKVRAILQDRRIPLTHLVIDEVGIGSGVLDSLRGARGFIANSRPMENPTATPRVIMKNGQLIEVTPQDNFQTLKDQCGYYLAEKVNQRLVAIDTSDESLKEQIEEELGQLKDAEPDKDTKKRLVPKDEIKEAIGRSPDNLDNFLMRVVFDLLPAKEDTSYANEARVRRVHQQSGKDSFLP
jgi:hypothetical protein